jgi:exosome complex component RRP42
MPIASPRYQAGPPEFNGIELPRLVDRAIRESKMIDLDKLCIKAGEKVWTVYIDIFPINDDGNLIDAANIAALVALKIARVPEITKEGKVDHDKEAKDKLPLSKDIAPVSFSFFKLGNSIIVDPTREEAEACDARITFGLSKSKDKYLINSCQKKGEAYFTGEELAKMSSMLPDLYEQVNEKLKKFL